MFKLKMNCRERTTILKDELKDELKDGIDVSAEIVIACTQTYGNLSVVFKERKVWYVLKSIKYSVDILWCRKKKYAQCVERVKNVVNTYAARRANMLAESHSVQPFMLRWKASEITKF